MVAPRARGRAVGVQLGHEEQAAFPGANNIGGEMLLPGDPTICAPLAAGAPHAATVGMGPWWHLCYCIRVTHSQKGLRP